MDCPTYVDSTLYHSLTYQIARVRSARERFGVKAGERLHTGRLAWVARQLMDEFERETDHRFDGLDYEPRVGELIERLRMVDREWGVEA